MFAQTWRKHWGLGEEPFTHEDADKDPLIAKVDASAVHSSFDRLYGTPETPGPGIVFGEKGSGKSGLRLAIRRRLEEHNEAHPESRAFLVDYVEFDFFLEQLRQSARVPIDATRTAPEVVSRFRLADHLDAILSRGVTALVDHEIDGGRRPKGLTRKQKLDVLLLTALYYHSKRSTRIDALRATRRALRYRSFRPALLTTARILLSIVAVALLVLGFFNFDFDVGSGSIHWDPGVPKVWYSLGALVLIGTWMWTHASRYGLRRAARRATKSVRILPREPHPLMEVLETVAPAARREVTLPIEHSDATRYHLLQRFLSALQGFGYQSLYVLVDRVDESTLLGGKEEWTRPLIETLLDHKLLQHPGVALKLFLPIELAKMYLGASPDELKRMRLDKSNTVQELRWTGQELYEIANQRLRACRTDVVTRADLGDFLGDDLDHELLRDTLHELGTPRHAFGFLSSLFSEYARNLPEELESDSPDWRMPRSHFEVVRAAWADRARVLRRTLN